MTPTSSCKIGTFFTNPKTNDAKHPSPRQSFRQRLPNSDCANWSQTTTTILPLNHPEKTNSQTSGEGGGGRGQLANEIQRLAADETRSIVGFVCAFNKEQQHHCNLGPPHLPV